MNKYSNLEEFMRETGAELHLEFHKMYFDDGEWVVMQRQTAGSRYFVVDRFLDAVPGGLDDALRMMDTGGEKH